MKGMILQYTSSNGQTFDLKCSPLRTKSATYTSYDWAPQAINQQLGANVYRFDKNAKTYQTVITITGNETERRQWLNLLHAAFEHDIITMTPGRITHGMYYMECYIISSSVAYSEPWTNNTLSIYCPYPFWRRDIDFSLSAGVASDTYDWLDYPHGFPYDYKATLPGYSMITNPGVKAADWKLTINGQVENPVVVIDGRSIGVNAVIGSGETLVISSRDKTVMKGETNLFNSRIKSPEFFDPIPSGEHSVMWSGLYDVDLTVYEERSEPLWI
jgi:hypothetical protein